VVAAGVGAAVVVLVLLAAFVLWLLNAPLAWKAVAVEVRPTLIEAMLKTAVMAAVYFSVYGYIAVVAWRRVRRSQTVQTQGAEP
jgi:hypothetical protein